MDNKIRILEITEAFGLGGTEQAVQIRAELINKDIFDVIVIGFYGSGPRKKLLEISNIKTFICDGDVVKLKNIISQFNPHIIHYYRGSSKSELVDIILLFSKELGIPVIFETNVFGRKLESQVDIRPDFTVHMSMSSMLRYSNLYGKSMVQLYKNNHRVIYLPVPRLKFNKYILDFDSKRLLRKELGIGEEEIVGVRVARPDLRKWSTKLEVALPHIFSHNRNLRLILMAAPERKIYKLQKLLGDKIIFIEQTSSIKKISEIYQISNFMLHSSGIGESFGLSMAEGMFWGLPVIVDSTPLMDNAQIEVVDHNENGIIVNSSSGFIKAVFNLISNKIILQKFSLSAKEKAIRYFEDEKIVKQWEKLYIQALSKKIQLNSNIISYSDLINDLFTESDYFKFPKEYANRLNNYLSSKDSLLMKIQQIYLDRLNTIHYTRTIGFQSLKDSLSTRIRSGHLFKRV